MDTDFFTDLLSAAMSESGLTDLETYDDQPVADNGSQLDVNAHSALRTPVSQELMSVSVQPPQLQTNSIILQRPVLQTPVRPVVVQNDTAKGVQKIVIRPLLPGLQQSIPSRQQQPAVLQSTSNRPPLIPSTVTSVQSAVRPVLPVLRTTVSHTGSNSIMRSQTAPSILAVSIPSSTVHPALSSGSLGALRFTAIPRHLAARLPASDASVSLQIRPRLSASIIVPRTAAPVTVHTVHPQPALSQACVSLPTSNFVQRLTSNLSSTDMVSISSSTGSSSSASVAHLVTSIATECVSTVASIAAAVSCISSVPTLSRMQVITSCSNTDSANPLSVTSPSSHSELVSMQSNMMSQADKHIESCSTVVSPGLLSSDHVARCMYTSGNVTVSPGSVVFSGNVHTATSVMRSADKGSALTSSENLTVTAASSEAVNAAVKQTAVESESDHSTVNCSAAEADDQQVRL